MKRKGDTKKAHKSRTKDPLTGVWQWWLHGGTLHGFPCFVVQILQRERKGVCTTFYTGIPGMHLFLVWLCDRKSEHLISSSASTAEVLCN